MCGFLIADIPKPIPAAINPHLPLLSAFKYLANVSPAKAKDVAAFNGFSALFHPQATEPNAAPIPAPNSMLVLAFIFVAFIPKFHIPAAPAPNNAVGLVATINAPDKYLR